jgi:hypothetical protein
MNSSSGWRCGNCDLVILQSKNRAQHCSSIEAYCKSNRAPKHYQYLYALASTSARGAVPHVGYGKFSFR